VTFSALLLKRRIKIAPNLLLTLGILTGTYIILPFSLMGSLFADVRLGPAIALLWVVSIDIKAEYTNSQTAVAALALLLSVFISIGVTNQWAGSNKEIAIINQAIQKTESGAIIFSATAQPYPVLIAKTAERRAAWAPPLKHIASYAVLGGPKFVPMTFVDPTKQPLNVTLKYQSIKAFQGDNPRKTFTANDLEVFLLQIKQHLRNGDWPLLENVYVLVTGFDRINADFSLSAVDEQAEIININESHVLIKLGCCDD
jgi:hypothetical protein